MSVFGGLVLTNRGRNLQAKVQAGTTLNYTGVKLGDGALGTSNIADLTALKNTVLSLPISKLKVMTGGRATIGFILKNNDLTNGFYFRELGVFAQDPDLGEILYCYGNAANLAEYIPAGGGADIVEKTVDLEILTGNASSVSAVIDNSLVFETPEGAQAKADAAETNAKNASTPIGTFNAHSADEMPHEFTDTTDSKNYRYGFKTNAAKDGLVFVYEEVL